MRRPANDPAGSTRAAPEVNVRVARVVLHGVDARSAAGLDTRVRAELAQLLGGRVPGVSATSDAPAGGGAHDAIAARVARSVYARLPR